MSRRFSVILLVMMLLVVASTVTAQDDSGDTEPLAFFLTFVPNIQFAPLYMADDELADAGYDLQIQHGDEPVGVDLIANGELDFGMISGEQVVLARAGGRPVTFVYEWFQAYPVGLLVPESTGADAINDLEGRKLGLPGRFGASYSGLIALLNANDMRESDVQLEPIGFAAPDVLCNGGVDAATIYVNNEPIQVSQRIESGNCEGVEDYEVFQVSDYADMVSNGIVTNEATIESDPERVRDLLAAFDAGLQEAINNPARAYLVSLDYIDDLPINDDLRAALESAAEEQAEFLATDPGRDAIAESRAELMTELEAQFDSATLTQFRVLLRTIDLWDAERLGYTDPESWQVTLDVLERMDALVSPLADVSVAYSNAFLPPADDEDTANSE